MAKNRNKEGIIIRFARYCWKALTIFLAIQSATVAAVPLRGTGQFARTSSSTTREVNGVLRAEIGDLCAQATIDEAVPCSRQVDANLTKRIDSDGGVIRVIDIELFETPPFFCPGKNQVGVKLDVRKTPHPKYVVGQTIWEGERVDIAAEGHSAWRRKQGYCYEREMFKPPVNVEIPAAGDNQPEFILKRKELR